VVAHLKREPYDLQLVGWWETSMVKARAPFLEDGSQFGISRTAFRRTRKAQKRELMLEWFGQNFEDPAQSTSYVTAEGGYLWNHGGPYDAKEQLFDKFGDIVPEFLIDEVVEDVEEDGLTEWAGNPRGEGHEDYEPPPGPPALDSFSDEPNARYGSKEDHKTRDRVLAALAHLRAAIDQPKPVGIGHNNPPEDEPETDEVTKLRTAVTELQVEFAKPAPPISLVKKLTAPLRDAVIASMTWIGKKLDKAVDAAMTTTGAGVAVAIGTQYNEPLRKALSAIIDWLKIVATQVF
jgi:hypothetical protein